MGEREMTTVVDNPISIVVTDGLNFIVSMGNTGLQGPAGGGGGGGVTDGDKGDVVVTGGGTIWTLDPTATSLVNKQPLAAVLTNTTASYTVAEQAKLAAIADGATANSSDATLLARANHTGTQSFTTITGTKAQLDAAVTDGNVMYVGDAPTAHTHLLAAGATDVTMTAANLNTLDDGVDTTLHFHAADRARANHTGTQAAATITGLATIATSGSAADLSTGLLPAARFDDTAHGSRAGGALHANVVAAGAAGFMTGADKTKLDGIAAGAQVNVGTDLAYTASTRLLASSTGVDVTLPLVTSTDAGLAPASGGGTTNFLRADGAWAAAGGGSPVTVQDEGVDITTALGTLNFVGAGVTVTGGATATVTIPGGGGGVSDGDKGDITVSGGGTVWTIDAGAVTLADMADIATSTLIGRTTAGTGVPEALTATEGRTVLGLGTLATQSGTFSGTSSGTNTGDQTSIVGITGTRAQFNTAVTDGNVMYVGDAPTAHTHVAADVTDFDTAVAANSAVAANTAKVTNATHTGDVTGATALTITTGVVSNAKLATMPANTIKGNNTGAIAAPADMTVTQTKTLLAYTASDLSLAAIATSGSAADLSTGLLPAARFDDTAHGSRAGGALHANVVAAGAAGFMTGADKTKLDGIAAGAQVNVGTDLAYTASTRLLASSTGVDVTLPLVTSTDAGLAPASGGGTTNFLRADGAWAAAGGGSPVTVQDEGVDITTALGTLNFVGAGVTVTGGATATVTIPGGGGGGGFDPVLAWAF